MRALGQRCARDTFFVDGGAHPNERRAAANLANRVQTPRGCSAKRTSCVFSSHSFWTSSSLDVPAGVTQEEGHTQDFSSTFFLRCVP